MKRIIAFLCLVLIFSCKSKNEQIDAVDAHAQAVKDSLTIVLDSIYNQKHINGFAVAIVNDSAILFNKGYGYADVAAHKPYATNTITNIASISKTFIGVALLKAQELGKLKLDDPINNYLPYEVKNPYHPQVPITIRHLATHTSTILDTDYYGKSYVLQESLQSLDTALVHIPEYFNGPETHIPLPDYLEKILAEKGEWYQKEGFLKVAPGERYEYSNIAATLAAQVLELATAETFIAFTQKHIMNPLAMTSSGWELEDINQEEHTLLYESLTTPLPMYSLITYPDGGFRTSSTDLATYFHELIKGYVGKGSLLQTASYHELFRKQLQASHFATKANGQEAENKKNTGIFMSFRPNGLIGHSGGDPGIASFMFFDPNTNMGRILIINTELAKESYKEFLALWETLEVFGNQLNK